MGPLRADPGLSDGAGGSAARVRRRLGWLLGCALLGAFPASLALAQEAALRIGYVDFDRVANNAPQITRGRARIDEEFRPRSERIEAGEQRLVELEERLVRDSAIMTRQQVEDLELEARALRRRLQREREDLADEISFRVNEVQEEVEAEIGDIVRRFAEENGYDLILVTHILYVSDTVDITDQVIAILQRDAEAAERGR